MSLGCGEKACEISCSSGSFTVIYQEQEGPSSITSHYWGIWWFSGMGFRYKFFTFFWSYSLCYPCIDPITLITSSSYPKYPPIATCRSFSEVFYSCSFYAIHSPISYYQISMEMYLRLNWLVSLYLSVFRWCMVSMCQHYGCLFFTL